MLDTLRANSRSVVTYVLFGIIIIVFVVSFGPGSKGCEAPGSLSQGWAAKVNGEAISPGEFEQQYGQLLRLYQQQASGDAAGLLQFRLRQMAMDQIIQRELVEQEARRHGIAVTDDEVSAAVKAIPSFQTNGQFDLELYKRSVSNAYGSPAKFEEQLRRDLGYQKMTTLLRGAVKVTDEEVKDAWMAENDRLELELVRFPLSAVRASAVPTQAQIDAVDPARIEKSYKDNPARFDRKKRVKARHILAKADEKAGEADREAARKKAEQIAERLKKGEDFAAVAREVSDDPGSKDQGGDLGYFGAGVMAKEFEDAVFALKPGEISPPVKTRFGWHLVKVEEVQEPEVVPLEKARAEIGRELAAEDLARVAAKDKAAEVMKRAQAGRGWGEVKLGPQVVKPEETGPFTASAAPNVPKLGPAPELFADALQASSGQLLAKVYETSGGPVVARVKDRQRPDPAKFPERRAEMEARLRLQRETDIERAWVDELRRRSKVEPNQEYVMGTARASSVPLE